MSGKKSIIFSQLWGWSEKFWPSLRETRDKQPMDKDEQELVSPPHYEYDKAFLVTAHGSMGIGGSIQPRWEVLCLTYNRCKTRGKWPLGKEPDRSWCHRHTPMKISWSQPMDPWTERQHTRMLQPMCMEPWALSLSLFFFKEALLPFGLPRA